MAWTKNNNEDLYIARIKFEGKPYYVTINSYFNPPMIGVQTTAMYIGRKMFMRKHPIIDAVRAYINAGGYADMHLADYIDKVFNS